ncbi:MAG: RNA polymerase sigma-54 factor, partial [Starkeya sp.]|nr:RNA polymerase sigma-54 factor [Starkeya sp.]
MSLGPRLEFRQTQSLVMTPQLMQAIKLLQLSNLDLVAYVEAELERNPLLERQVEPEGERAGEGEADAGAVRERTSDADLDPRADQVHEREERVSDWLEERLETSRSAIEDRLDTGMENVFPDDNGREPAAPMPSGEGPAYSEWTGAGGGGADGEDYNLEAFVSAETSLADHLEAQLVLAVSSPVERLIGHNLIDLIDEAGYLTADLASVAERLGAPLVAVEK